MAMPTVMVDAYDWGFLSAIGVRFLDRWEEDDLTPDAELEEWPRDTKPEDP